MSNVAERRAAARARRSAAVEPLPSSAWPLSSPLRGTPVAVIDTETTGLLPEEARIVSVAVVWATIGSDDAEVVLDQRVNPGIPIPPESTKVHGITDEDVAAAPTWADVWPRVHDALHGRIPAAFNAVYDWSVLSAECQRTGGSPWNWKRSAWLDPFILVRGLDQYQKGKRLGDAARRRGIDVQAHGAAGDAMTTALLLTTLLEEAARGVSDRNGRIRFRAPASPSVEAYLRWQRNTALEQERDFAAFMSGQGRREPVDMPWHRLEGVSAPTPARPPEPIPTAACSSCGQPLVWVVTKSGRKMPCDPAVLTGVLSGGPEGARELFLVQGSGDVSRVQEAPPDWPGTRVEGRISHFATCKFAADHRRT